MVESDSGDCRKSHEVGCCHRATSARGILHNPLNERGYLNVPRSQHRDWRKFRLWAFSFCRWGLRAQLEASGGRPLNSPRQAPAIGLPALAPLLRNTPAGLILQSPVHGAGNLTNSRPQLIVWAVDVAAITVVGEVSNRSKLQRWGRISAPPPSNRTADGISTYIIYRLTRSGLPSSQPR